MRQRITYFSLLDIARLALALFSVTCGIKLVSFAINIIRAPFPLELREGAILSTTQLLLQGRNPFAAENLPQYMNGYGIVYNLVATPLAGWFGNTFQMHRLLTLLFILAGSGFIYYAIVRRGGSRLYSAALVVCVLANAMYSVTPLTRPDGLGFLLFVLAILIPWLQGFSKTSLLASAILATLAFYTKLYFYLPVPILGIYLFLFTSKRLAVWFGVICSALLGASILVVASLLPYYFYTTLFMATYQTVYVYAHVIRQMRIFLLLYAGVFAAFLFAIDWRQVYSIHFSRISFRNILEKFNFRDLNQPMILAVVDFPAYALIFVTLTVIFKLGGHDGSKMAYLFQLMSPLVAVVFARLLTRSPRFGILACALIAITLTQNLLLIGLNPLKPQFLPDALPNNPARYQPAWDQARNLVRRNQHILNDPLTAGLLVLENRPVVDNGHTEYFHASQVPDFPLYPPHDEIAKVDKNFRKGLLKNVREHYYDLIFLNTRSSPYLGRDMLKRYYHIDNRLTLYAIQNRANFELEVWLPNLPAH